MSLTVAFPDTMGYAFTYPVVRYLTKRIRPKRVPIIAYIHYPTISLSMLRRVSSRESNYANSGQIASSTALSTGKLMWIPHFSLITPCLLNSQLLSHVYIDVYLLSSYFAHNTLGQLILDWGTHRLATIDTCAPTSCTGVFPLLRIHSLNCNQ
jgi:hypothetical protein